MNKRHRPQTHNRARGAFSSLGRALLSRIGILALGGVILLVVAAGIAADYWYGLPEDATATYVGRQSCIECHQTEAKLWSHSHHDLAMDLATRFSNHAAIAHVLYPGLPTHPGHELARRQMQGGFGGMLSIRLRAGENAAIKAAANVKLWKRATSLGGVESLIEHRASIEGPGSPCPPDLLRLSTGIEDVDDLYNDLAQALK